MTTARKLLTADDLLAVPRDGNRHELVRGELITMPPPSFRHTIVTGRIGHRIDNCIEELGLALTGGPGAAAYIEQNPDTVRAADYGFYSRRHIPSPPPERGYVPGLVPVLAVEVISPGYRSAAGIAERVGMWLDAGVRLVVVAYIATREIVTYGDDGTEESFEYDDTLTLEPVLPGFACPVADIFAYQPRSAQL